MKRYVAALAALAVTATLVGAPPAQAAVPFGPTPYALVTSTADRSLSDVGQLAALGRRVLFAADDGVHGRELWITDGTPRGTRLLEDIRPGDGGSVPTQLTTFRGRVYFEASDGVTGRELWVSDGTAAGTRLLKDLRPGDVFDAGTPRELTVIDDLLWFSADSGTDASPLGREPWVTDGTTAGTRMVDDVSPGPTGSLPFYFTALGGRVLFRAERADVGAELWSADRDAPGDVTLVEDVVVGEGDSEPGRPVVVGGFAYLAATHALFGRELFRTDGSPDSFTLAAATNAEAADGPEQVTAFAGKVFFSAADGAAGRELVVYDPVTGDDVLVEDLRPGDSDSTPRYLTPMGGHLYFSASDGTNGSALFRTDATGSGAELVHAANPEPGQVSQVFEIAVVDGRLVYAAAAAGQGREWWTSSGAPGNGRLLLATGPGEADGAEGEAFRVANTALLPSLVTAPPEGESALEGLFAWTARASSTVAKPARSYTAKQARLKRITVPVVVRGAAGLTGTVTLRKGRAVIGRARVVNGKAAVRVTKRLAVGRHKVRASYSGSFQARTSTSRVVVVKVVR